ncbi:MAG TPA: GDSL-type esterase/lipase family protein [Polyangiaceae bacterium]|nr:GDSL-type esterase/lipase family protein [Polyangiaceae bacterium]
MAPSAGAGSGGSAQPGGAGVGLPSGGAGAANQAGMAGSGPLAGGSPNGGTGGLVTGGDTGGGGGGAVDPTLLPAVTLHLAGDSTVMTYAADSLQEGWGQELPQFLLAKVTIDNQALGGSSVKTFYAGRWQTILENLHSGDYVAAAFGANDSGTVEGRHVEPPEFQATFAKMADEVRAKQATFIAVTPSALQQWSGGVEGNQRLEPYVTVLHSFDETSDVKLVDLNARSVEFLNQIGQEAAKQIYINGDKAHFTKKGATQMAQFVAQELARVGSPLGDYVK